MGRPLSGIGSVAESRPGRSVVRLRPGPAATHLSLLRHGNHKLDDAATRVGRQLDDPRPVPLVWPMSRRPTIAGTGPRGGPAGCRTDAPAEVTDAPAGGVVRQGPTDEALLALA